jgi:hypothetical protein
MADVNNHTRFPRYVQFRVPEKLPTAIAAAAEKRMTTISEYLRQAVIKELKSDGFDELIAV